MRKLWRTIAGYFPSTCESCRKMILNKNKILMAACNAQVYYRGKGICGDCSDKKLYAAQEI